MDGIEQYVPEAIIAAARDYVEREVIVAQPDGAWRNAGYQEEGYPQETYDDWRIESIRHEETETVGDMTPGSELFEEYVRENLERLNRVHPIY